MTSTDTTPAPALHPLDARIAADEDARLLNDARRASVRRAHETNPDVVALVVAATMRVIERAAWTGITLGLLFTMTSVQQFGANGAATWSMPWLAAWLLAPLVEIPLLAILRGEQLAGRHGIEPGPRVRRARWLLLTCTYALNTWTAWAAFLSGTGAFRDVVLHTVPPVAVLAVSSAMIDLRQMTVDIIDAATRAALAVRAATRTATTPRPRTPRAPQTGGGTDRVAPPVDPPPPDPADEAPVGGPNVPDEPRPPAGPGPLGDGRTLRQIGIDWALANWRDDLAPVAIGRGLLAEHGLTPSKGERSRMRDDAQTVVEAARELDPDAYRTREEALA